MPTKPLERLMFAQGSKCFFCAEPLSKDEASVEHLVPSARSGSNLDDNCVACCKTLNSLLGCMSLKEKIKVVLNQKGDFKCPNSRDDTADEIAALPSQAEAPASIAEPSSVETELLVVAHSPTSKTTATAPDNAVSNLRKKDILAAVIKNLASHGKSKPLRVKTLTSTIKAMPLQLTSQQVQSVVDQLRTKGKIVVTGTVVAYKL